MDDGEIRAELARNLCESADRVEGCVDTREEAEQRAADFARQLHHDPTIIYDQRDDPTR
jgi:hypothetical protein